MASANPNRHQVATFLEGNFGEEHPLLESYTNLICNDAAALRLLDQALRKLEELNHEYCPPDELILKSLTFFRPEDLKAVLVAHDPMPYERLATGLAFSLPNTDQWLNRGVRSFLDIPDLDNWPQKGNGKAMAKMKKALRNARIEDGLNYDLNYKHWAERGVLLWNASLTIERDPDHKPTQHHNIWLEFSKSLIRLMMEKSTDFQVGLFWGSEAKKIFNSLPEGDTKARCRSYDHPTWDSNHLGDDYMNNAEEQFTNHSGLFREKE